MEFFSEALGLNSNQLAIHQMLVRALIVFIAAIIFVRIAGLRTLGAKTTYDFISHIMLGAILGRAIVVSDQPFFESLGVVLFLVLLHRLVAWLTFKSHAVGTWIKGNPVLLVKDGKFQHKNLAKTSLSTRDVTEAIHLILNSESMEDIHEAYLERSGEISIIKKGEMGKTK